MRVHLPRLYGKILNVVLGSVGCPLDGLCCFQKNIGGSGYFRLFLEDYEGNLGKNGEDPYL